MSPIIRYKTKNVAISLIDDETHKGINEFDREPGLFHYFQVVDNNLGTRNKWKFEIFVPDDASKNISVQPKIPPYGKSNAGLKRRSVLFMPATKSRLKKRVYCQTFASVKRGNKVTRKIVKWEDIEKLPYWLRHELKSAHCKNNVVSSNAADGDHPVLMVKSNDYISMIKHYFILRVWTLRENIF